MKIKTVLKMKAHCRHQLWHLRQNIYIQKKRIVHFILQAIIFEYLKLGNLNSKGGLHNYSKKQLGYSYFHIVWEIIHIFLFANVLYLGCKSWTKLPFHEIQANSALSSLGYVKSWLALITKSQGYFSRTNSHFFCWTRIALGTAMK